uniref:Uncharacterized protein n=1 Tax=Steinernema glaseri TaxID=37863 RepID=A0A1I7YGC2_9BILA
MLHHNRGQLDLTAEQTSSGCAKTSGIARPVARVLTTCPTTFHNSRLQWPQFCYSTEKTYFVFMVQKTSLTYAEMIRGRYFTCLLALETSCTFL